MRSPTFLFVSQIFAHLALIFLIFSGSTLEWSICFGVYFLTGCFGMSMTYHRLLSHKSWRAPQWFKWLGALLGTIGLTGSALAWVAIHRQHHANPDKPKDPHSPNVHTWWNVQFFSMYYRPNLRFVKDLLKDKFIIGCHRHYLSIQFAYIGLLFIADPKAVIYAYLAPAAILWHGGSLINTIGHKWGYRNFSIADKSVNNPLLGFLMWGEGWHNNHHAKPNSKSFKIKFWEIDISYLFIKIFETKRKKFSL